MVGDGDLDHGVFWDVWELAADEVGHGAFDDRSITDTNTLIVKVGVCVGGSTDVDLAGIGGAVDVRDGDQGGSEGHGEDSGVIGGQGWTEED